MELWQAIRAGAKRTPFVRPIPEAYLALSVAEEIDYVGDRPLLYRGEVAPNPFPVVDYVDRPWTSVISGAIYTPPGLTVYRGRVDLFHSALTLERPFLVPREWTGLDRIPAATIIQTEFKRTYGDFVTEILKPIAVHGTLHGPLLLPGRFARRPYVAQELDRLGIDYRPVDRPVRIESALVLHKLRHLVRWTTEDVACFRAFLKLSPPAPRPGSLLFLSREGVGGPRVLPHREISRLVEDLGGTTVPTAGMRFEDYLAFADRAETVVAEHGSAMINLMSWRTRSVIEIAHDHWWGAGMMSLARSSGVRNHAIVRHSGDPETTVDKVRHWIGAFRNAGPAAD